MEERTYISSVDVFDIIDNVGKCRCYDDARKYLNAFVIENVGKHYEAENGTKYRNSHNPQDIKREALATIDNFLYRKELIDEASEETLNEAIKYHNLRGGGSLKSNFVNLRAEIKVAKQYVELWRTENAPILQKKETVRLRPIAGKEHHIDTMFERLIELGYLAKDENKEAWRYLCGTSDDVPKKPMRWLGDFTYLCALYDFFLVIRSSVLKKTGKGSIKKFAVSLFGYDFENGFKQRFSRDYTTKLDETGKKKVWSKMKDPQILFTV